MLRKVHAVVWCVLLLMSVFPTTVAWGDERTDKVDELFVQWNTPQSPGCALGVIADGKLVYGRGYGMADLDHGVPISTSSVFRIGSTSKQFTAFSIQLLVEEGKLSLDDDIRRHVPELPAYDPSVTIRHLLHHTSGYRDYLELMDLAGMRDDDFYTDPEVLDLLALQNELNFPPGEEYLYSNSGYFLLAEIVKRASGKSLREYAHQRIFEPLEMHATHFHNDHREIVPNRAVGYAPKEGGGYEISLTTLEMIGDGGVFTTVEDLVKWDSNFYAPRVGSAAVLDRMIQKGVLNSGKAISYASGLDVSELYGLKKISHGGSFVGYRAEMLRFPEERLSVICLCNRSDANPETLAQKVADIYLADRPSVRELASLAQTEPEIIELPLASLEPREGAYRRRNTNTVARLRIEEGRLVAELPSGYRLKLAPLSTDRFIAVEAPVRIELLFESPARSGQRSSARLLMEGAEEPRVYDPVDLANPSPPELAELAGSYRCDELVTTVHLTPEEGGLRLRHENRHKRAPEDPLEPTLPETFAGGGMTVEIVDGAHGEVQGIRLSAGRVRNILCLRKLD